MSNKLNSEKGAISLYVLSAMLVITIILVAIYVSLSNKQLINLETAEQIKSIYEKDVNNMDSVYNDIVNR